MRDTEYIGVYISSYISNEKNRCKDSKNKKINIFNKEIISTTKENVPILSHTFIFDIFFLN